MSAGPVDYVRTLAIPCVVEAGLATNEEIVTLIHDVFGNPFRSVNIDPEWLTWRQNMIPRLAQSIYDGAFADLPVLADVLEEAGCAEADMLAHCREPGPHVKGCWTLDLILKKHDDERAKR